MKKIFAIAFFYTCLQTVSAQPAPYRGTLIFNLTLDLWQPLSPQEIKKMDLKFLSRDKEASLHYDSLNNHFVYSERGFNSKCLYLVYRGDTVTVRYASVRGIDFHLLAPLPPDRKSYTFDSPVIYDAIHPIHRYTAVRIACRPFICAAAALFPCTKTKRKNGSKKNASPAPGLCRSLIGK